jgi:hypothetical protein
MTSTGSAPAMSASMSPVTPLDPATAAGPSAGDRQRLGAVDDDVAGDRRQPPPDAAVAAAQDLGVAPGAQERLRDHVGGGVPVAHEPVRVGQHRLPVLFVDGAERRLIGRFVVSSAGRGVNRAMCPSICVTFLRSGCIGRPRAIAGSVPALREDGRLCVRVQVNRARSALSSSPVVVSDLQTIRAPPSGLPIPVTVRRLGDRPSLRFLLRYVPRRPAVSPASMHLARLPSRPRTMDLWPGSTDWQKESIGRPASSGRPLTCSTRGW